MRISDWSSDVCSSDLINKWTHGTLITAMHGHAAFYGAYAMIIMAVITYAMPTMTVGRKEEGSSIGYWAFWLQIGGMRTEERRVGKEWGSKCRSRWSQLP